MSYVGVPPFGQTVRTITEVTATAGQTAFTPSGGYLPGYIDVTLNGAALTSADFTATNGTTVTLTVAAAVGDEFRCVAYWPVSLVDTYRKGETDSLLAGKLSTANGAVGTNNLADGAVTSAKLAPGAGGATCRAWVNFNGTGTVAIRAAFNVSSITDNGTVDYTVNFTTAMPDANYSVNGGSSVWISNHFNQTVGTRLASASSFVTKTVSSVRVSGPSNSTDDSFDVNVVIFR